VAYLLHEGQINWITGIATLDDDVLEFTWNVTKKNKKSNPSRNKRTSLRLLSSSSSISDGR